MADEQQMAPAPAPAPMPHKNNTWMILGILFLVLLICSVLLNVYMFMAVDSMDDDVAMMEDEMEEMMDEMMEDEGSMMEEEEEVEAVFADDLNLLAGRIINGDADQYQASSVPVGFNRFAYGDSDVDVAPPGSSKQVFVYVPNDLPESGSLLDQNEFYLLLRDLDGEETWFGPFIGPIRNMLQ